MPVAPENDIAGGTASRSRPRRLYVALAAMVALAGGVFVLPLLEGPDDALLQEVPVETDFAHLREHVAPSGTHVRITDAIERCDLEPFQVDGSSAWYGFVSDRTDGSGSSSALTESDERRPCSDAAHELVGVARIRPTPTYQTSRGRTTASLGGDIVIVRLQ